MALHFFATPSRLTDVPGEGESYWPGQYPLSKGERSHHFRGSLMRVIVVLAVVVLTFGCLIGLALSTIAK